MRVSFSGLRSVAVLIALFVGTGQTAELPPVEELQRRLGTAARTVAVYEPHLSMGDSHVAIEYVGYQANDVMARLFGGDWQGQGTAIEFRALDGYISRIDVSRFAEEGAYLVFARKDGAPFTVDQCRAESEGRAAWSLLSRLGQHLQPGPGNGGYTQLALSSEGGASR